MGHEKPAAAGTFTLDSLRLPAESGLFPYKISPNPGGLDTRRVGPGLVPPTPPSSTVPAPDFLTEASKSLQDRAASRDQVASGERSMKSTVEAFNALTGHSLTEAEGWEFMILLKLVRGRQGKFRMDDYVDASAYAALLGECESVARKG